MCHMNTVYNNQDQIASDLINFFTNETNIPLSIPNIKNLAYSLISMCDAESVVTADLANSLKSSRFSSNKKSNIAHFWRFFNNDKVNIYAVFNSLINYILSNISNIRHNELIVTIDHMYIKDKFVILMFTLRIDEQGIPIWFSLERTSTNCHSNIQKNSRKKVFSQEFLINAIDKVIASLKHLNAKIYFLADRWFFNLYLLKHIEDKGCFYAFRAKVNSSVKVLVYDKHEGFHIYKHLSDLKPYVFKTAFFENLPFGDMAFKANLAISPSYRKDNGDDENWYIITNLPPKIAIRKYKKRFASIECFFKNQKTNGFYLEATKTKNLHAMETLYGITCIAHLWLTILGIDYIKNYNHKKHILNIPFNKKEYTKKKDGSITRKTVRTLSTFKLGLSLFKKAYYSYFDYHIKCNFKLYL